jgi:ParB family chromosome partitioning protein
MHLEWHQLELKYERVRIVDPERDARLMVSLEQIGQQSSVLVVKGPRGHVLIDGYGRVRALRRLGRDRVWAVEMPLTEVEALVMCHGLVNVKRRTALEDGWLIQELMGGHGRSQREVAKMLGRSWSWVSRRLALVRELPEAVQEHVRNSKLCAQAAMKYLVPLARANAQHCEKIADGIASEGLSARQVCQIYVAWRKGDDETRERITGSPMLFVRTAEESRQPEPPDPMEALMHDVETVGGLSRRARRRVRDLERVGVDGKVVEAWRETYRAVRQLHVEINRNARA